MYCGGRDGDAGDRRARVRLAKRHGGEGKTSQPIASVFPAKTHGHGIAEYCRNVDADLVILGAKGRTNLQYVLLGSTVERLLKEVPCSVLVVRPPVSRVN